MPILTLFAGPNGSGKSTIVNYVRQNVRYSYPSETFYLNADDLEQQLRDRPHYDLRVYELRSLSLFVWNQFVRDSTLTLKICQVKQISTDYLLKCVKLVHGSIILKTTATEADPEHLEADSYIAALIIDFIRYALIDAGKSFAFETVMSHPDKLNIMQRAKEAGFTVRLYYITTRDPDINVSRVKIGKPEVATRSMKRKSAAGTLAQWPTWPTRSVCRTKRISSIILQKGTRASK